MCPHVPYGPAEVARSAIDAGAAGAAGVHFHARYDDGSQDMTGDDIYRRAMELTAAESDVVMWTTAYPVGPDPTSLADLPHQWALTDRPPQGAPLRFGCFDAFRIGRRPAWSQNDSRFIPMTDEWALDADADYETPVVLAEMLRRGLSPVYCCYDLGDARWASCATRAGVMPSPSLVQLQIFASSVIGPSATAQSLEAYIAEGRCAAEPELSFVGFQFPTRESYEEMLKLAIQFGMAVHLWPMTVFGPYAPEAHDRCRIPAASEPASPAPATKETATPCLPPN